MGELNQKEIMDFYNSVETIWPSDDKWHLYTRSIIQSFIIKNTTKGKMTKPNKLILNAGSAGEEYSVAGTHFHVDIAKDKIKHLNNSFVCSIEETPFENNFFDLCICVGSVINYCDVMQSLREISRVLKPGGQLILEFDNSSNFEYFGTPAFNKSASIVKTFYNDTEQKIWVYNSKYINKILKSVGFQVIDTRNFHIASSIFYKINANANKASKYAAWDKYLDKIPLAKLSCNIILCCEKKI